MENALYDIYSLIEAYLKRMCEHSERMRIQLVNENGMRTFFMKYNWALPFWTLSGHEK